MSPVREAAAPWALPPPRAFPAVMSHPPGAAGETVINRVGSMWTSFFTSDPVVDWDSANKSDRQRYGRFFHAMLDEGVYLAPSQFEAGFVSLAHTNEVIDKTIEAARKAMGAIT